jgi:hypothetical protein
VVTTGGTVPMGSTVPTGLTGGTVPTATPATGSQTADAGGQSTNAGTSVRVANCVIGSNDADIDCSGDKAQQGLGGRLKVSHALWITCALIVL